MCRHFVRGVIENFDHLKKQDLVYKILDHQALNPEINFNALGIDMPEKAEPAKKPRAAAKSKEKAAKAAEKFPLRCACTIHIIKFY